MGMTICIIFFSVRQLFYTNKSILDIALPVKHVIAYDNIFLGSNVDLLEETTAFSD
jgi:hypothetical protein